MIPDPQRANAVFAMSKVAFESTNDRVVCGMPKTRAPMLIGAPPIMGISCNALKVSGEILAFAISGSLDEKDGAPAALAKMLSMSTNAGGFGSTK